MSEITLNDIRAYINSKVNGTVDLVTSGIKLMCLFFMAWFMVDILITSLHLTGTLSWLLLPKMDLYKVLVFPAMYYVVK